MYKGKLKHVKELLLAFQELRKASAEMNSFCISLRARSGGKENKAIRKELLPLLKQMEEQVEVYSRSAYYFRSLAREELARINRMDRANFS